MNRLGFCVAVLLAAASPVSGATVTTASVEQKQKPWIIPSLLRDATGGLLWVSTEVAERHPELVPEVAADSSQPCGSPASGDVQLPRTVTELASAARDVFSARVLEVTPGFGADGAGSMLRLRVEPSPRAGASVVANGPAYLFISCSSAIAASVAKGERVFVMAVLQAEGVAPALFFDSTAAFLVLGRDGAIKGASTQRLRDDLTARRIATERQLRSAIGLRTED